MQEDDQTAITKPQKQNIQERNDEEVLLARENQVVRKKPKEPPETVEDSLKDRKNIDPHLLHTSQEEETKSEDSSSFPSSSVSEVKSMPKESDSNKTLEGNIQTMVAEKPEPEKKITMEEKIADKKATKKVKDEEPVFSGLKLKKSKPVQRKWTEDELEVVELKRHKFEQLPQLEMVN